MPKNKIFFGILFVLPFLNISAFAADESVSSGGIGSISLIYGTIAVLSLLLLFAYIIWEKNKEQKMIYSIYHLQLQ